MGRLSSILICQWRAYWRRFARSGNLTAGNQGIMLIIALIVFYKYIQALTVAANELHRGKTAMLERLLVGLFFAWLFPLLSSSRLSVATRSLRQWPLTLTELFIIRSGSQLITPFAWLIVTASLAIAYPLSQSANPLRGMLAGFLFIVSSWLIGLTVAQLLSIAVWRKVFVVVVFVVPVFGFYVVKGSSVQWLKVQPARFVAEVAIGERSVVNFLILGVLLVFVVCAALWSFRESLEHVESPAAKPKTINRFFIGKTGPLSAKDLRYFAKLLDPYFGLLAAGVGCFYLAIADVPQREVFWIFMIFIFFPNASLTFNPFGLDSRFGLERYALFPISGREVVSSKNLAYVVTMTIQILPLLLFAIWRIEISIVAYGILEAALLALAYLTWGNLFAARHRFKMEFYRFSSGGSPIDALVGVIFSTLPGAVSILLFVNGLWWVSGLMLIGYAGLYWLSLERCGRKLDLLGVH